MSTEVLVLGFDCAPSFHSGEELIVQTLGGSVRGRAERAGGATLTGSSPVCKMSQQNEGDNLCPCLVEQISISYSADVIPGSTIEKLRI